MTLQITESGPSLSAEDLTAAEHRLNAHLPDDYRTFLLANNGGKPTPAWFRRGIDPIDVVEITRFFSLEEVETETQSLRQEAGTDAFIAIGMSSDIERLALSTASEQQGGVFWNSCADDAEPDDFIRVADSVTHLLTSLDYPESTKPWMTLIDNDDVEGLRQWIDSGGDVQAHDDVVTGITALDHAARAGRLEIVKLLVSRGAKPRGGLLRPSAHRYAVQAGRRDVADFLAKQGMARGYWLHYVLGAASVLAAIGLSFVPRPRALFESKLLWAPVVAVLVVAVAIGLISDWLAKIRNWWHRQ
jgi:cell wall assembly regulator SMI1